jgi:hypothetical protein
MNPIESFGRAMHKITKFMQGYIYVILDWLGAMPSTFGRVAKTLLQPGEVPCFASKCSF